MAILLLVNAFAAGIHLGSMAAGSDHASVFCAASSGHGDRSLPAGDQRSDCCCAGCMPAQLALAVDGGPIAEIPTRGTGRPDFLPASAPPAAVLFRPNARGPPILA
jgi:hypothetical protein